MSFEVTEEMNRLKNKMIYDITQRIDTFSLNTVVSGFMEYTNKISELTNKQGGIDKSTLETFAVLLAPFAPHIAEEMWEMLGHSKSVFDDSNTWPNYDEEAMKENSVEMAVQVNGKVKAKVVIPVEADKDTVLDMAKEALGDKLPESIKKEIYVPGKIINIVG